MKNILKTILPHGIIELYREHFNRQVESDIQVINFQVNNYCNSRCAMCDIWRKNDQEHVSAQQFYEMLKDPLFKNVQHIGITGGEPTLVKNLDEFFKAAIDALPQIHGLSLITNSLMPKQIKHMIRKIFDMCQAHGKGFSVMVSLDGISEMHDLVRGREGNFEKTLEMIDWLKIEQIPFSTGTTITKHNVWNMDKVLNFLKRNQIYGRFRIGEFINRLYNSTEEHKKIIRNFNEDELYQLQLFFSKLEYSYETNEQIKNTYRSIRHMLQGGKRLIECPYKLKQAVNLDCHGGLAYCAPKSEVIGNLLHEKGTRIYAKKIEVLEEIHKNHCMNCIHDYHSVPTDELIHMQQNMQKYKEMIKVSTFNRSKHECNFLPMPRVSDKYHILIVGWYGTETVGDKAILGGILQDYYARYGQQNLEVFISSLYPFITERTIKELGVQASVVPVYSEEFFRWASAVDEVVVGGGPLMELDELALILWAFHLSKSNGHANTVFGSGIGPLYSEEKIEAVKEILCMADHLYFRDAKAVRFSAEATGRQDIRNIGDPAIPYVQGLGEQINPPKVDNKLSCYLREITREYLGGLDYHEYIHFKDKLEEGLARNIKYLCRKTGLVPHFYAMHNFVIGNDDRDFNDNFVAKYFSGEQYYLEEKVSTVETIIESMKSSQLNLCMRFHSVVFADTLNTQYVAIDYTSGGKINAYLEERNQLDRMTKMTEIMEDETVFYRRMLNN